MEKDLQLKTADGYVIHGTLNKEEAQNKLVIFVHGLNGNMRQHLFYNAARFFPKKGFATFRFDLYNGIKGGRCLSECTISTHSEDLNNVIEHFKGRYKELYLAGHSLGCPTIIYAKTESIRSIVLWEPSFNILEGFEDVIHFNKCLNKYIVKWGTEYLLSSEMLKSWKAVGDKMLPFIKKPTKIICAGKGTLYKEWKPRMEMIRAQCELCLIEGAGHSFDEEDTEQAVFVETLKWFKKTV